ILAALNQPITRSWYSSGSTSRTSPRSRHQCLLSSWISSWMNESASNASMRCKSCQSLAMLFFSLERIECDVVLRLREPELEVAGLYGESLVHCVSPRIVLHAELKLGHRVRSIGPC